MGDPIHVVNVGVRYARILRRVRALARLHDAVNLLLLARRHDGWFRG